MDPKPKRLPRSDLGRGKGRMTTQIAQHSPTRAEWLIRLQQSGGSDPSVWQRLRLSMSNTNLLCEQRQACRQVGLGCVRVQRLAVDMTMQLSARESISNSRSLEPSRLNDSSLNPRVPANLVGLVPALKVLDCNHRARQSQPAASLAIVKPGLHR